MERSKIIIIGLLIINLIVMISYGNSIRNKIDMRYNELQSYNSNLMNQMNNLEYQITSNIKHILINQADGISDFSYALSDVDYETKQGKLYIELSLKEVTTQAQIVAIIKADSGIFEDEIVLEQVNGLTYSISTLISLQDNYTLNIYESLANGETKKLNVNELTAPLYDEVYVNRVQGISRGTSSTSETLSVNFNFTINEPYSVGREVEKVVLLVKHQDQIINEVDLTSTWDAQSGAYAQYRDEYNLKRASGIIDDSITMLDYIEHAAGPNTEFKYGEGDSFYVEYSFEEDELELIRNSNDNRNDDLLDYRLKFSFKDGYSFEY